MRLQAVLDVADAYGMPTAVVPDPSTGMLCGEIPDGVPAATANLTSVTHTESIDADTIEQWLEALLDSTGDSGAMWSSLRMEAAKVRVYAPPPETLRILESQEFEPVSGQNEGGFFVAGPCEGSSVDPPIVVDATHEGGQLDLHIQVVWPLWSEAGGAGMEALSRCIRSMVASGWTVRHASGPFASLR